MPKLLYFQSAPEEIRELVNIPKIPTASQMNMYIKYLAKEVEEHTFSHPRLDINPTNSYHLNSIPMQSVHARILHHGTRDTNIIVSPIKSTRLTTENNTLDWSATANPDSIYNPWRAKFYENIKLELGLNQNPIKVTAAICNLKGITRCQRLFNHSQNVSGVINSALRNIFQYEDKIFTVDQASFTRYRSPTEILRYTRFYIEKYSKEHLILEASSSMHQFMNASHYSNAYIKLGFTQNYKLKALETTILPLNAAKYNYNVKIFTSTDRVKGRWWLATILFIEWGAYIPSEIETFSIATTSEEMKIERFLKL